MNKWKKTSFKIKLLIYHSLNEAMRVLLIAESIAIRIHQLTRHTKKFWPTETDPYMLCLVLNGWIISLQLCSFLEDSADDYAYHWRLICCWHAVCCLYFSIWFLCYCDHWMIRIKFVICINENIVKSVFCIHIVTDIISLLRLAAE